MNDLINNLMPFDVYPRDLGCGDHSRQAYGLQLDESLHVTERPPATYGHRYLDIRRDHAFKFTFGREETKELLIDLLNCLLSGRKAIRDLRFAPVERSNWGNSTRLKKR